MRTSKHSHNQQYTTVELGQWQDVLNGGLYHITRGRKLLTKPGLIVPEGHRQRQKGKYCTGECREEAVGLYILTEGSVQLQRFC